MVLCNVNGGINGVDNTIYHQCCDVSHVFKMIVFGCVMTTVNRMIEVIGTMLAVNRTKVK